MWKEAGGGGDEEGEGRGGRGLTEKWRRR